MCWPCREEDCPDFKGYNIGSRTDDQSGLMEHYCKGCDVPLVRWMQDPNNDKSEWAWRRIGWIDVEHTEEYEEVVVKTRTWVERKRVPY